MVPKETHGIRIKFKLRESWANLFFSEGLYTTICDVVKGQKEIFTMPSTKFCIQRKGNVSFSKFMWCVWIQEAPPIRRHVTYHAGRLSIILRTLICHLVRFVTLYDSTNQKLDGVLSVCCVV